MVRILFVDPNPKPYKRILERAGYAVVHTVDIDESLVIMDVRNRIGRSPISIVVSEMHLIGGQDLQLVNKVLTTHPNIPIIIHTDEREDEKNTCLKYVNHYVLKDSKGKNLLKRLKEITKRIPYS